MSTTRVKNFLITGPPGSGKSTLISCVVSELTERGVKVGGVVTPELRKHGRRVAFLMRDLLTGEEVVIASVSLGKPGPRVSKYRVDVEAIDRVGAKAIQLAIKLADVIVIDEVGKMELFSRNFSQQVVAALESNKPVLATIPLKSRIPLIEEIRMRKDSEVILTQRARIQVLCRELSTRILHIIRGDRG
ncbi:MAG: hypothetical protein DRN96_00760 [Thermoproteota archaeon]|nr:MAG: hypothetical protein DRN96_00760 [Candidatus Korarchaeota archaeon]